MTSNPGLPTPSITAETRECTGLIEAITFVSAFARALLDKSTVVAKIVGLINRITFSPEHGQFELKQLYVIT